MSVIYGNLVGGIGSFGKTFVIEDVNGSQLTGVVVEELTMFNATAEDVKLGKVAASDSGIIVGTHVCE